MSKNVFQFFLQTTHYDFSNNSYRYSRRNKSPQLIVLDNLINTRLNKDVRNYKYLINTHKCHDETNRCSQVLQIQNAIRTSNNADAEMLHLLLRGSGSWSEDLVKFVT